MRRYVPEKAKLLPENAECKFRGELFDVYQWPQEMYDGSMATFEMLRRADTVEIVAIKDDKIVITRQIQPHQDWFYAYPGGRVDEEDADELAGAKRELAEETGMTFANWKLAEVHQPMAKMDWLVYTFIATDFVEQGEQKLDNGEKIEVLEVSFDELKEIAQRPDAKYLWPEWMTEVKSLEELKDLPGLYEY